ncbi:MAG TPA: ABC transporter permease [Opitutales bacterium]|nr:ABC transporter permease [Opitutales bacterium]
MTGFIIRRLLSAIPLLFAVSVLAFVLISIAPGDILDVVRAQQDVPPDYIEELEREFGLDKPWYFQYGFWLKNALQGNLGHSWTYKIPVVDLLMQRVPATILLSLTSLLFAWSIAIPLGVLAAIYKDSIFDRISSLFAYAALSLPEFFLALLAVMFAANTGLFPVGGRTSIEHEFLPLGARIIDIIYHLILPTIVLGIGGIASTMRIMRANFLDSIRAEYVTTARAKGVKETWIMFRHVLRNAINPLVSASGFAFASLLSGALLVENVMNYPGLGQLVFEALIRQDQYVVVGAVLMGSFMLLIGNLLADLLLAWIDPRIRLDKN